MGCVTSKQVPSGTEVTAVGSTERNLARKEQRQKTGQPNSKKEDEERAPPRLDSSGRLTSEEIVFRTARSKMTKSITVGSLEFPIQIEVRQRRAMPIDYILVRGFSYLSFARLSPKMINSMPAGRREVTIPKIHSKKTKMTWPSHSRLRVTPGV